LTATPAQQLISGYRFIARRARRAGVPTLIATLTPMKGAFYDSPIAEATRTTVNDWIRQQHLFDGVVDFAKAVADPHDPSRLDPAYDSGDHLHPNAEGFAAMARIVDVASLQRLFGAAAGRSRQ
jgi:lysophospholipase L1-like esterase